MEPKDSLEAVEPVLPQADRPITTTASRAALRHARSFFFMA